MGRYCSYLLPKQGGGTFQIQSSSTWDALYVSDAANLWRHVIRRSAEGICRFVEVDLKFTHAKVRNSDVALIIKQEIVQLEVSVAEINKFFIFTSFGCIIS